MYILFFGSESALGCSAFRVPPDSQDAVGFRALLRVQEGRVLGMGVYEKDIPGEDPGLGFWVLG